ncbi:hypothetical protein GCWU000282_01509 [Catonella morbi ATCC 51271]|uniref:Uncharacterized protein n=1 Tax=Catonella morbi ATCC 51271 TaxID=592026 RepID=V2XKG6_9FIRM|nr:hypothetical protein GCWU000282_01509 [Catonella morbi ATCC 51271]
MTTKQNAKWLIDITEFVIPAEKAYISMIVCYLVENIGRESKIFRPISLKIKKKEDINCCIRAY